MVLLEQQSENIRKKVKIRKPTELEQQSEPTELEQQSEKFRKKRQKSGSPLKLSEQMQSS
jgi:hypothetical protein